MVKILHPFQVVTSFFSYEEKLSSVIPVLHGLLEHLKVSEDDVAVVARFKMTVANEIKRRWNIEVLDPTDILVIASAFDQSNLYCRRLWSA